MSTSEFLTLSQNLLPQVLKQCLPEAIRFTNDITHKSDAKNQIFEASMLEQNLGQRLYDLHAGFIANREEAPTFMLNLKATAANPKLDFTVLFRAGSDVYTKILNADFGLLSKLLEAAHQSLEDGLHETSEQTLSIHSPNDLYPSHESIKGKKDLIGDVILSKLKALLNSPSSYNLNTMHNINSDEGLILSSLKPETIAPVLTLIHNLFLLNTSDWSLVSEDIVNSFAQGKVSLKLKREESNQKMTIQINGKELTYELELTPSQTLKEEILEHLLEGKALNGSFPKSLYEEFKKYPQEKIKELIDIVLGRAVNLISNKENYNPGAGIHSVQDLEELLKPQHAKQFYGHLLNLYLLSTGDWGMRKEAFDELRASDKTRIQIKESKEQLYLNLVIDKTKLKFGISKFIT